MSLKETDAAGVLAAQPDAWLAAIVENSNDAILSKTLDGVITSWNRGAQRLFGYEASEAIGKHITLIIPQDRLSEEDEILRRLRNGERIVHFETVRRRKTGELIDISLTVSPVRDSNDEILGASKIARDITQQKHSQAQQKLLLREMRHRIKNLFTLASGLVTLSARDAKDVREFSEDLNGRLHALARAHGLTLPDSENGDEPQAPTTIAALIKAVLAPYELHDGSRVSVSGCDSPIAGGALSAIAMVFHELASNAVKYGSLASPEGRLEITCSSDSNSLMTHWIETCVSHDVSNPGRKGFGSTLEAVAIQSVGGTLSREWTPGGVSIVIELPFERLRG